MTDDVNRTLGDGRHETVNQRMDRNWSELLQELRVTQTGTQILTGFLLAIAFQPRLVELEGFQTTVYAVLVGIAVLATLLALVPVSLHRSLFRRQLKPSLVTAGHHIMRLVLIGVVALMAGTLLLVFDWVLGRAAGLVAGGAVVLIAVAVAVIPGRVWPDRTVSPDPEPPAR